MTSLEFITAATDLIHKEEPNYPVHLTWFCKTIQNWKGLFCTISKKPYYYEVTYNGDKKEMYVDKYEKVKKTIVEI